MKDLAVLKFGGSSVKSLGRIQHVAGVIASRPETKRIVVVSAMGDTTDYLLGLARRCDEAPDGRELDMLLATGEQVSIALLAMTLRGMGLRARSFTGWQLGVLTDSTFNDARILDVDSARVDAALAACDVMVVAGFQGASRHGELTTLGRGGSDTSAVAIAAACGAPVCDIYTDVDGLFSFDPRLIPVARLLDEAFYEEVIELAHSGAQVIHPRAVEIARDHNVALRIRNTFKPDQEGTWIQGERTMEGNERFTGVALDDKLACLTLVGLSEDGSWLQALADLLSARSVSAEAVVVAPDTQDGRQSASIFVRCQDAGVLGEVLDRLRQGCRARKAALEPEVSRVALVGRGFASRSWVVARFLAGLRRAGIAVKHLSCTDGRLACLVPSSQGVLAASVIHREFELDLPAPRTEMQAIA